MVTSEDKQLFQSTSQSSGVRNVKFIDLLPQLIASSLMYLPVIQAGINMSFASVIISQLADGDQIKIDTESASIIASIFTVSKF